MLKYENPVLKLWSQDNVQAGLGGYFVSVIDRLEGPVGFEPTTPGLKVLQSHNVAQT